MDIPSLNIALRGDIDVDAVQSFLQTPNCPFDFILVSDDTPESSQAHLVFAVINDEQITIDKDTTNKASPLIRVTAVNKHPSLTQTVDLPLNKYFLPGLIQFVNEVQENIECNANDPRNNISTARGILDNSLLIHCDKSNAITYISAPLRKLTGYEIQELNGKPITFIVEQESDDDILSLIRNSQTRPKLLCLKTKNNNGFWVQARAIAYTGKTSDYTLQLHDVNEIVSAKIKAENINAKLREYENILQALLSNNNLVEMRPQDSIREVLGVGIVFLNLDLIRLWVSDNQNLGYYCRAEIHASNGDYRWHEDQCTLNLNASDVPQQIITCKNQDDFKSLSTILVNVLEQDKLKSVVFYPIYYRGQLVAVLQCGKHSPTSWNEEIVRFTRSWASYLAMLLDIQCKNSIREELLKRETAIHPIRGNSRVGQWEIEKQTGAVNCNRFTMSLFGIEKSRGIDVETINNIIHEEDASAFKKALSASLQNGNEFDLEHRVLWEDGTVRWLHQIGSVLRNREGDITHLQLAAIDITYRVTYQNELIKSRQQALQGNKIKTEFFARINHELKTPLNAILGFAQVILKKLDDGKTDKIKEYVTEIIAGGKHLQEIISEVIDLAKLENGTFQLSIGAVDLDTIFTQVNSNVSPIFSTAGIKLVYQDRNKSMGRVLGDPVRIKQILINFLSNASKYCPPGSTVTFGFDKTQNDTYRLYVRDDGPGIPDEMQSKIFQAFQRSSSHMNMEGSGVGLTITKELTELMNGEIGYTSEPDQGTCFWVELPKAKRSASTSVSNMHSIITASLKNRSISDVKSVIYIDDSPSNIAIVQELLDKYENAIDLRTFTNPLEGIAYIKQKRTDLILLDINLPNIDGYHVLDQLRTLPHIQDVPIVAVTAYYADHDTHSCKAAGFDDFIAKPIDVQMLYQKIEGYLNIAA